MSASITDDREPSRPGQSRDSGLAADPVLPGILEPQNMPNPTPSSATADPTDSPRPRQARCSQELRALAERFSGGPVPIAGLLQATHGRGFNLLLVCLSLPFISPIPLPGLSLPFGAVVALIGGRLALGRQPWLPQRLLRWELPPGFLSKVLKAASWIVRMLEFCLRPRLCFLSESLMFRRVGGVLILISGLLLVLPLPLPFTNSLPAWTVLLLAAGALERDGASFLAGCSMFLLSLAYFGLLAFGGAHALDGLKHAVFGG